MAVCVINHRLGLVLRFIDTTTGKPVAASDLMLYSGKTLLHPSERARGTLVFTEPEMADFILTVKSRSFETYETPVVFSELDAKIPELDIQLVPSPGNRDPVPCLSLTGRLPGISGLSGARCGDNSCLIREFDPRRRRITVFNPHRLELGRSWYGLVDPEKQSFEVFKIVKRIDDENFKTDRVLESSFNNYFPVTPLIFGVTSEDGRYAFRVRDDSASPKWMVHYEADGKSHFYCADLREQHELGAGPQSNILKKE